MFFVVWVHVDFADLRMVKKNDKKRIFVTCPGTGETWNWYQLAVKLHRGIAFVATYLGVFFLKTVKKDGWIGVVGLSHVFVLFCFFFGWGGKNDLEGDNFRERVVHIQIKMSDRYIHTHRIQYGIFTYIWLMFMVNVGKCPVHGSFG